MEVEVGVSTKGVHLDELQIMFQSLAAGVQNVQSSTSAAAFAAVEAKKEQVATTCAITSTTKGITSMENDVKKVAEDVGETKKSFLQRRTNVWKRFRRRFKNMQTRFNRWNKVWLR